MPTKARRPLLRSLRCTARRALQRFALLGALLGTGGMAAANDILSARYTEPTDRYAHAILGDAIEWGALELTLDNGTVRTFRLPQSHVFEDLAPRLADLDGDGTSEVIVIDSSLTKGARLAIYGPQGLITATDHIGRSNRWLAPAGIVDLDGDGRIEIAYVDRPHLARILTILTYENQSLKPFGKVQGLTNHRIGEDYISGGVRTCNDQPELVLTNGNWSRLFAVSSSATRKLQARDIGPNTGRKSFVAALNCAK